MTLIKLAKASDVTLHKATVTLTNQQIIDLPTTPIQIVAAPGVGKVIHPIGLSVVSSGLFPYTDTATDTNIYLTYTTNFSDGGVGGLIYERLTDIGGGADGRWMQTIPAKDAGNIVNFCENRPVYIWHNAGTLTNDDPDTTLTFMFVYAIMDIPV